MGARYDDLDYDQAFLDTLTLEIRNRIIYWQKSCDPSIPDHVAWPFKQRLYLLNHVLLDLQSQCAHALSTVKQYDSESDWLEDWLVEQAISRLGGKY